MIIPLFNTGQSGKSPNVTAQTHKNVYAEITPGDKARIAFYGTPGTTLFASFGATPVRGAIAVGDYLYCAHRGKLWKVDSAGARTSLGALATSSGRVAMAYNGTQIGIVDGTSYYVYTIAGGAFATVTTNLIGTPVDITFQDGYGILGYANGKFQITAAYDFTTLDALDYATAEANPDGLVRVLADHGELLLCGERTVEFWGNAGGQDFPYQNIRGATLEFGLAAPWSLVKYNDSVAGLFKNKMGQVQVMVLAGHALKKISSPELDHLINGYPSTADATALAYMLGGHPMVQLNFPAAGKSWLYDASTDMWSALESGLSGARHVGDMQVDYFGRSRVTDYGNGNIYTLDAAALTDNGQPIARELISQHLILDYRRIFAPRLQVDFETGVGLVSGQGSDPQVMLQISKDSGHTWGNERWASLGKIGKYKTRVIWRRLGAAHDWVFKLRVTDPVKFAMTNAAIKDGAEDE